MKSTGADKVVSSSVVESKLTHLHYRTIHTIRGILYLVKVVATGNVDRRHFKYARDGATFVAFPEKQRCNRGLLVTPRVGFDVARGEMRRETFEG